MKSAINLLPPALRRQQVARKRIIQWSQILCAILLIGWGLRLMASNQQTNLAQRMEVLEREHRPTRTMLRQLIDMREELQALKHQEEVARELEGQRHLLTVMGVVSQTAARTRGRLRVTKLEVIDLQKNRPADAGSSSGKEGGTILMSGVSLDNQAVAELLDGLQDSGIFQRVELLAAKERTGADVTLRDYEVRCEF